MIDHCVVDSSHGIPMPMFVKRGTDIYTCPTCNCIMSDVQFMHHQYEADNYYSIASRDQREVEQEWGFRWRYVLGRIRRLLRQPRLLDVGAGNGYFVHLAAREFGFGAHGVEISDAEIAYAREMFGVELYQTGTVNLNGRFDVVTSLNVLEHVEHPLDLLADMNGYLAKDGYLILTTPNPACIHRRLQGLEQWGMIAPPHHINLFTKEALREVLRRGGFEMLHYATLSTYVRFVRKIDVRNVLRRAFFYGLMALGLGADHLAVCRKVAAH